MKNLFFLFGLLALLLVLSIVFSSSSTPAPTNQVSQNTIATKTDSRGEVTVEATPKNIQEGVFEFEIIIDTHSVALDQDMVAVSKLVNDRGIEYRPILWKGDGPGGHHRSGILRFEGVAQKPKSIKLILNRIGGAERNFSWDL